MGITDSPVTPRGARGSRKAPGLRRIAVLIGSSLTWREQVLRGIASFAYEHERWHICTLPEGAADEMFLTGHYAWDGLLVRLGDERLRKPLLRLKLPTVGIGSVRLAKDRPQVQVNDQRLAEIALEHLLSCGLRQFAYCGPLLQPLREQRGPAFRQTARHRGYPCWHYAAPMTAERHTAWQRRLAELGRWLKRLPKPVGLFTWNADVAAQCVAACQQAGGDVPGEVAVLSSDDTPMLCNLSIPAISAVRFPARDIGYQAARILSDLLAGRPGPRDAVRIDPPGGVVARGSTELASVADREVHLAVACMREHLRDDWTVADIAASLRVSRRWLERQFERVLQRPPGEHWAELRLEQAATLLQETDLPAATIAARCGYCSAAHFNRVFRQRRGCTPGQFRQRVALGEASGSDA